jgi:hypothetical protein
MPQFCNKNSAVNEKKVIRVFYLNLSSEITKNELVVLD